MKTKRVNSAVRSSKRLLLSVPLILMMPIAHADWGATLELDNEVDRYKKDRRSNNTASLGLGVEYRGEKFNIDSDTISYDFSNKEKYAIEVILKTKNRGFEASDRKIFAGLSERRDSIDVGARGIVNTKLGPIVMDVTRDLHASKGHDVDIRLGGIAPHSKHWNGKRELKLAGLVGLRYQSEKVVDYHYGVKSNEATASRASYKAKAATTPYVGVEAQFNFNKHVSINAGVVYERRDDAIRNSPLTNEKKDDVLGTIGLTYWF